MSRARQVALVATVAYLPFVLVGYGTDIDVPNLRRAGRAWIDGHPEVSRRPGSAPVELVTGLLDRIGGSALAVVPSVAFAGLALWCLGRILARDGARWPTLVVAAVAVHPWFWVAATSLGDFTWALGLLLAGIDAAQRDRRVLAGACFGLAVGCRASTVLLVVAWLAAESLGRSDLRPPARDRLVTAAVALGLAVACFLPAWAEGGRGLFEPALPAAGAGAQLGRWAAKNLAVAGLAGALVVVAGLPALVAARHRWTTSATVRFAVLGLVATEVLFLRFPLKPVHLLPAVACLALVVGASPRVGRPWLWLLVASQVVHLFVGVRLAAPDEVDAAAGGRLRPGIGAGVAVNDLRCRLDDLDRGPWPDPGDRGQDARARARGEAAFACQQRSWRADP